MSDNRIDSIMEQASQKLADTDYLACEALCMTAQALARQAGDFERYARVMLPLQEARRQRRQIAADADVAVLGEPRITPQQIVEAHREGCLLLISPPYDQADEQAVRELAREQGCFIEVLTMDKPRLRQCFEDQLEREGDAAIATVDAQHPAADQLDTLETALRRIGDHEIAHQRLAALAKQAAREQTRNKPV